MNCFIFNRGLRCVDNTTLIYQMKTYGAITPIFVFTEQINKKNEFYNSNSIEFMCETLQELDLEIKNKYDGKLYLFHNDRIIKVLKEIHKNVPIKSLGTNFDYSPYARQRQDLFSNFCKENNIMFVIKEDHVMYNILEGQTHKPTGEPYSVFTPFRNNCMKTLKVPKPDLFKKFIFKKNKELKSIKYYIPITNIDKFYDYNKNANIRGGRINGLKILKNLEQFKDYVKKRDMLTYHTTFLSAHNHFGTVSIREVHLALKDKLKSNSVGLINEIHWRDFYYNLYYNNPHMLAGQIGKKNLAFKPKFDKIKWSYNKTLFKKWCDGTLGIPSCDAGMRQLNTCGFMHNRLRMLTAAVLTKLLMIPWQWGEKYFATKLLDYDSVQNGGGWGWTVTGIDPTQLFRIFSPKSQSERYDPECIFIKYYLPELASLEPKDIHNWEETYQEHLNAGIKYYAPAINYKKSREQSLKELKRVNKIKN